MFPEGDLEILISEDRATKEIVDKAMFEHNQRMKVVVDAALKWQHGKGSILDIANAVDEYERSLKKKV